MFTGFTHSDTKRSEARSSCPKPQLPASLHTRTTRKKSTPVQGWEEGRGVQGQRQRQKGGGGLCVVGCVCRLCAATCGCCDDGVSDLAEGKPQELASSGLALAATHTRDTSKPHCHTHNTAHLAHTYTQTSSSRRRMLRILDVPPLLPPHPLPRPTPLQGHWCCCGALTWPNKAGSSSECVCVVVCSSHNAASVTTAAGV